MLLMLFTMIPARAPQTMFLCDLGDAIFVLLPELVAGDPFGATCHWQRFWGHLSPAIQEPELRYLGLGTSPDDGKS